MRHACSALLLNYGWAACTNHLCVLTCDCTSKQVKVQLDGVGVPFVLTGQQLSWRESCKLGHPAGTLSRLDGTLQVLAWVHGCCCQARLLA
jgi:hypothetical protein